MDYNITIVTLEIVMYLDTFYNIRFEMKCGLDKACSNRHGYNVKTFSKK